MVRVYRNWTTYRVTKAIQNGTEYEFTGIGDDIVANMGYIETDSNVRLWSNGYGWTSYFTGSGSGTWWTWIVVSEGYFDSWIERMYWGMFYVNGRFFMLPLTDRHTSAATGINTDSKMTYGKLSDTEYWMVWGFRTQSLDATYIVYKIDVTTLEITFTTTSTQPTFVDSLQTNNAESILSAEKTAQINAGGFTMQTFVRTRWGSTNDPWAMYARMRLIPVT